MWRAFGRDVPNYVEPFAGSLAMLLGRPGGAGKIETVNDRDRYLANFWRAVVADPYAVAAWADGPVNEADLHARHRWLVNQTEFRERMHAEPDFYDPKIAGWWVWGLCQWIGGGWCVEPQNSKHPKLDGIGKGVHSDTAHRGQDRRRPTMSSGGMGVHAPRSRGAARHTEANRPELAGAGKGIHAEQLHAKRPHMAGVDKGVHQEPAGALRGHPRPNLNGGQGVHAQDLPHKLPFLALPGAGQKEAGKGVHSASAIEAYSPGRRPSLGSEGQGVHLPSLGNDRGIHGVAAIPGTFLHALAMLTVPDAPPAFAWFAAIMLRMRRVRVACGDWRRVLGDSVLGKGKNVGGRRPCGVFLDPPYAHEFRDPYLYSEDDASVSAQVREWALEHGDDPDLRIALCGYDGEHEMPSSWMVHAWKGARGYASEDNENRERERIWFSPHCLPIEQQRSLFAEVGT